jgi:hypothetical protein
MSKVVGALCVLVLIAAFLGGFIVGGWQALVWFDSGVFPDISVLTALHWLGIGWPTDSTGFVPRILSVPLAALLFAIGGIVAIAVGLQWSKSL